MKKALSLILVLVMLLDMMPMQIFAAEGTQETEAVEVVTEPTEAPEEETTAPAQDPAETESFDEEEETESFDEEEETESSDEEEGTESSNEEEKTEPSEPSEPEEEPEVVHEHDYEAVVTDPTCTKQGYTTYTCTECGHSYVSDYTDAIELYSYRWEMDNNALVSVSANGNTVNALTLDSGSVADGILNKARYTMQNEVRLYHDAPWTIEWCSVGNWSGMLLSSVSQSPSDGLTYLFRDPGSKLFAFGEYTGTWNNYGLIFSRDMAVPHVFRLENRIAPDGTNMVYLLVDGEEVGAMHHHYVGGTNKNATVDWADGKDIVLRNIGTSSHPMNGMQLEYLHIWESGHNHSYQSSATAPTCTEKGFTTYTCECGDSYVGNYVDAAGHTYENGVCTGCGAVNPDAVEPMALRYDDHVDMTGKVVEILDAGKPTSYQVGYGVEENKVLDTTVVTPEGNTLVATGIGTAMVRIDGQVYEVNVTAAPISLLLIIGQSNAEGMEGNANQSVVCEDGQVYSTYAKSNGLTGDAGLTVENAGNYVPSALTGAYANVNVNGTDTKLSDYPVYSLTDAGAGKYGMDSGLAYEWVQQTGEKVWVVNAAHGGTSINTWQKGADNYDQAVALFRACQQVLQAEIAAGHYTFSHMGYYWNQGCADEAKTAEWYVGQYLAMHENLKMDLACDMDGNAATADNVLEFGNILLVQAGHSNATGYRQGVYEDDSDSFFMTYKELELRGPRVAQIWMANNPELTDIHIVSTLAQNWVTMPDGSDGVAEYFQTAYPDGTVDYTTQVKQSASWYTPTTPAAVKDTIHYNQIGYNEIGREAARNTLYILGILEKPQKETTVQFLNWTGYENADTIKTSGVATSDTLVVPLVYPCYESKTVQYTLSDGLTWSYYDLLDTGVEGGMLTASVGDQTVNVTAREFASYRFELVDGKLVCVSDDTFRENQLAATTAGTYTLTEPIVLMHNREWTVEFNSVASDRFMALASSKSTVEGMLYFFKSNSGTGVLAVGEYKDGLYQNYGLLQSQIQVDWKAPHVYRFENKINADGSNVIHIFVDNEWVGTATNLIINSKLQNTDNMYLSGKDLVFTSIGCSTMGLGNGQMTYLEVREEKHNHTYENGICAGCGAAAPSSYAGKTIACIGDSITYGVGVTRDQTDYVTLLAKSLEMDYIRLGASGTTLCTDGHATCNIRKLTEANLAGADVVTILMGINDFVQAKNGYYSLGTIDSTDTSTIYGAAHMWCQRIVELRQTDSLADTEFYFMTPVITSWNNSVSSVRNWDQAKTNIHGYRLRDLCNAIIEVCAMYDIPVIDLNLISGLYYNSAEDNNTDIFGGDGAHPGADGHQMMASAIENALLQNHLRDDHDHFYGSWITTAYPDCANGEQHRVCTICTATENKQLDRIMDHTYEKGICVVCGSKAPVKTISILGDSISTYQNWSNGTAAQTTNSTISAGAIYYPRSNFDVAAESTWWYQAAEELGMEILVNNSWSGSCLLNTRSGTVGAYADRCVQLHDDTGENAGQKPDIIAIFLGTNDYYTYPSTLGTYEAIDFDKLIAEGENGFCYAQPVTSLEAYAISLHKIGAAYPDAQVYCFTLLPRVNSSNQPTSFNEDICQLADKFGAHTVDLYDCGIQSESTAFYKMMGNNLHPDNPGMDAIANAFISEVLKNSGQTTYDVSFDLVGTVAMEGTSRTVVSGNSFEAILTPLDASAPLEVTVTMGGTDITDSCWADSMVTIPSVTADVVITAKPGQREPLSFRWETQADILTSVTSGGNTANSLTMTHGTITDGVFTKTRFTMSQGISLRHDLPWRVEWKSSGTWTDTTDGALLFAEANTSATADTCYFYRRHKNDFFALGSYTGGKYHNYGVKLSGIGIDTTAEHVFRLENRITADGSNMIWLIVDEEDVGPLNHHYIGGTDQKETVNWVSGRDFTFSYLGTNPHTIGGCSLEYIQVWENYHTHVYDSAVTAPTCTEQGYTTYTCECGDSYVDDYVDTADHTYENGICTECGEVHTSTFQILDTRCDIMETFTYEVGMTWEEWLSSKYNTGMGSCIAIWVGGGPDILGYNPCMDIFVNGACVDYDDLIQEQDTIELVKYR